MYEQATVKACAGWANRPPASAEQIQPVHPVWEYRQLLYIIVTCVGIGMLIGLIL